MDLKPPYSLRTWKILGACLVGIFVVLAILLTVDKVSEWNTNRDVRKSKQKIANTVGEISNIQTQIGSLEQQKAEKQGELSRDVETLANQTYGLEDAKKETNRALANYNRAVQSNSNVDATAEDLQRVVDKLANTQ